MKSEAVYLKAAAALGTARWYFEVLYALMNAW
jgi:hypothetical protein